MAQAKITGYREAREIREAQEQIRANIEALKAQLRRMNKLHDQVMDGKVKTTADDIASLEAASDGIRTSAMKMRGVISEAQWRAWEKGTLTAEELKNS